MTALRRVTILRHGDYPQDPRVRREARCLAAAGLEVQVVCLRQPGEPSSEMVEGVHVRRLPWRHRRGSLGRYAMEYGASLVAMAFVIAWQVARRQVDLVQVNTLPDWLALAALPARLAGVPVLLDLHELSPELAQSRFGWPPWHPAVRLLGGLEQCAIRFADACLAVSRPCVECYVNRGAAGAKFTVVMNSPDPGLFNGSLSDRVRAGDLHHDRPLVITHGTLAARYGVDLLVCAATMVTEARFVLYGDGEARLSLERQIAELGLAARVTLAGAVPHADIAARIAAADIGVVANRSDVFTDLVVPTKLLEYVALGVPAVAAATPAVTALFDEDEVALFAPGDVRSLASALRAVLADPAAARIRAERARARLERDYGWPVQAAQYVTLVQGLIAARAGRGAAG